MGKGREGGRVGGGGMLRRLIVFNCNGWVGDQHTLTTLHCGCSLRVLDLAGNQLEGLPPPSQWKTQILKELVVSLNKITKVTESIFLPAHSTSC